MKMSKHSLSLNDHTKNTLVFLILVVSCVFLLSSCSTTDDTVGETITEPSQSIDHNVDIDPAPLSNTDEALSLEGYGAKGALVDTNLSIHDMLMYAVQDEYLARGEYMSIIEKFGNQKPYENIILSEETHLAYLKEVYLSYGIDFPLDASDNHIVVATNLLEAAEIGVLAEIDNIAMYELFLTYDLPDNVLNVFSALKSGSESHLLAFQKQVNRLK